jgi:hypothetical protein
MLVSIVGLCPAEPSDQRALLLCPKAEGVCFWDKERGWQKILDSAPESIVEFERVPDGRAVVLLRGHGNPGSTIVFTADGTVQAVRDNAVEANLQRLAGVNSSDDIVLCSETPDQGRCDVLLPSKRKATLVPWFPYDCLFPRFISDGSRVCLKEFPEPALLRIRGKRDVEQIALSEEFTLPSGFDVLSPNEFVFVLSNSIILFEPGAEPKRIIGEGVLWSGVVDGALYFSVLREIEGKTTCSLQRYHPKTGVADVWSSDSCVVAMAQGAGDSLLIDTWGGGRRQLILLPHDSRKEAQILWTEKSSVLWQ